MPTRKYTVRIKPTPQQGKLLWQYAGTRRFVWNWAIETIKKWHESGEKLDWNRLSREFTQLRNDTDWLKSMNYKATRGALYDVKIAMKAFFRRVKSGEKPGFPRFKSRSDPHQGFFIPEKARVEINRLVYMRQRFRLMRMLPGCEVGGAVRIKHVAGKWYASFTITSPDVDLRKIEPTNLVGIDIGLKDYAILSDGTKIANPRFFRQMERKLSHWQRKLARQKKGSNRRLRTKQRIAKIHAGIANRRKHFAHLQSRRIADGFDAACIESHSLKAQAQGRLAKSVHDVGHAAFRRNLAYKLPDRGKQLIEAEQFFASTKTCSSCGGRNNAITLSTRKWTCDECGAAHDRDLNAAKNLEAYGREQVAADALNQT